MNGNHSAVIKRIHYKRAYTSILLLYWVVCVSMYITRNRTIDWRSGVHNDTILALICASVNMWTHLLYGNCTALLFSLWMHPHDLRMRNDIVGSFFGIEGSWKWMAMNGWILFHHSGIGWSLCEYFYLGVCIVFIGILSSSIVALFVLEQSSSTTSSMWILAKIVFLPLHFQCIEYLNPLNWSKTMLSNIQNVFMNMAFFQWKTQILKQKWEFNKEMVFKPPFKKARNRSLNPWWETLTQPLHSTLYQIRNAICPLPYT